VLLQVLFHSQIAAEAGTFTIDDVLDGLADKLVRRHPHVFPNGSEDPVPTNAEQVLTKWEDIKRAERQAEGRPESVLNGVPQTLPALLRAYQIQARASRVGFDWSHDAAGFDQVLAKIDEEIRELRTALRQQSKADAKQQEIEGEFGDILFSLVNLARFIKVNPEDALRQTVNRFIDRFHYIERQAAAKGCAIGDLPFDEMNRLWEDAKRQPPEPAKG
jgi:tetrapyrrole methylase family protein/MazG family protein